MPAALVAQEGAEQLRPSWDEFDAPFLDGQTTKWKSAVTFWDKDKQEFYIYLSPYNDLTRDGNLHIYVEAMQRRGDGARKPQLDLTKTDTAKRSSCKSCRNTSPNNDIDTR